MTNDLIRQIAELIKKEYDSQSSANEFIYRLQCLCDEYGSEQTDSSNVDEFIENVVDRFTKFNKQYKQKHEFIKMMKRYITSTNNVPVSRVSLDAKQVEQLILYAQGKYINIFDLES